VNDHDCRVAQDILRRMNAIIFAVLAGLCWGAGELFTKSALHTKEVGPLTAIALRSTIALPVLWLAYFVGVHALKLEPRTWMKAEPATLMKIIFGSGLVAGAFGMICFYAALNLGEISRIKPIAFSIAPATAVVLGWLVLHEGMSVQKALGVALILAGVVLLTGRNSTAGVSSPQPPGATLNSAP
jgi:transporter family protein